MGSHWASSGAMALTGRADGPPLVAPDEVVQRIQTLGRTLDVDTLALATERSAISGLSRQGPISCGGATHLVAAADGWIAVSLARPDDLELVPAWLGTTAPDPDDPWSVVEPAVWRRTAGALIEQGVLLGMAVAAVPSALDGQSAPPVASWAGLPVASRHVVPLADPGSAGRPDPLVIDLSSLWAGPLCARLLGARGARVIKVESTARPDGSRRGPAAFFDLLHGGHESVALDFNTAIGRRQLVGLCERADVVIEASRPRALAQLGVVADVLMTRRPLVWVSITGHGRQDPAGQRIGFGDDAAVAGGLVARDDDGPCFVADAVADPLTGVTAAAAVTAALDAGGSWMLDVALAEVSRHIAGPERQRWPAGSVDAAATPTAPVPKERAAPSGEHTRSVLQEFGLW